MKLYILDGNWKGTLTVVASSREAAFDIMKNRALGEMKEFLEENSHEIEEIEIEYGLFIQTFGDS